MQPLISVIVPVYNVEKYLPRCLDSIINQTYEKLEIICVNDGSPDNSLVILNDYAAKDARIKIVSKQNGGLSSARNAGMAYATGEFITFVDSDDAIALNCYESCIKYATDDVDVVAFSFTQISANDEQEIFSLPFEGKVRFAEGMLFKQYWSVAFKIFRSSTLKKYDMTFREGFLFEDLDFCSRFFMVCMPTVYYINKPFYFYWNNPGSIWTNTIDKKEGKSIQHIYQLDNVYAFLKRHEALESSLRDFLALCEYCFGVACHLAPAHEQAKCWAEMIVRLRKWDLDYNCNPRLSALFHGDYAIDFNDAVYNKKLKGFERLFCVRREGHYKVIRLFSHRILRIKKG